MLDWRRKAATTAGVRTTILDVLDADLPAEPYPPEVFDAKVQAIFDHVATAYGDEGDNVYQDDPVRALPSGAGVATLAPPDLSAVVDEVVDRIRSDAEFASLVAAQLRLPGAALRSIEELLDNDEDYTVEFKSTARWDLREDAPSKAMEDAVVKTVAGFLNTDGGTLLIGIGPDREVLGLAHDYARVRPANGDGFVNWLTTHLINALGHTPVTRTRARITVHKGQEICRVDVATSPQPVRAKTSKAAGVLFIRLNNTTRALPEDEHDAYIDGHWQADSRS